MDVVTTAATLSVGAVFGLALAAPPGPMNAVIAEESVLRGWLAGFTAGLGAMAADLLFFALSLAGVAAVIRDAPTVQAVMVGTGGVLMLYFAAGAVREARAARRSESGNGSRGGANSGDGERTDDARGDDARTDDERNDDARTDDERNDGGFVRDLPAAGELSGARGFRRAFVLALTNPYQILFWVTVGVGLLEPGTVDVFAHLPGGGGALAGTLVVRAGSPALLAGLFGGIAAWIVAFPAVLVGVGRRIDAFAPAVAAASAVVLAGFGVTFCWTAATALIG